MSKIIETIGIVNQIINQTTFMVRLEDESIIIATISSKINSDDEIYLGEEVPIDMSFYDKTRGRINARRWKRIRQAK